MRLKGKVRWFDKLSGTGVVRAENGDSIQVYACNILGAKSMFEHLACMYLEDGQDVEFELSDGCGAYNVSNGILDVEQWEKIKNRDDLAFTLNESGAMSGLFKNK